MDEFSGLRGRLETMNEGDVARWGVMSAGEAVCHLREAFGIPLGTLAAEVAPCPIPRGLMKFLALRVPVRWPPNVATVQELTAGRVKAAGAFGEDLAGAVEAFDRFVAAPRLVVDHPIFGAMSTDDWHRWAVRHTDHHLRQFGR